MRSSRYGLIMLPLLMATSGCDLDELLSESSRFQEQFSYSYPLQPGGVVSLENFNGSVEILGWEKQEVRVTGLKYARTQAELREINIEAEATAGAVRLRTVPASGRRGGKGARYLLRVPREVRLEHIATSNGSLRVEDIRGPARLETSNGAVTLKQIEGTIQVRTSNGSITGDELHGEATLRTSNGSIRLDRLRGALEAVTSNAGITARIVDPAPHRPLRLETSNAGIELTMSEFRDNEVTAITSNGSITARLPSSLKARLKAATSNGSIHCDFDLLTRTLSKTSVEGDIGGGGALIQLTTSNASIHVLRL